MDRTHTYRNVVKTLLQEVAEMMPSTQNLRTELVLDDTTGHYQLGEVGWEGTRRVDNVYLHLDVYEGKVWLQHDGTNLRVAEDLVRAGIPKTDIILAFHPPSMRLHTDYGVA